MNKIKSILPKTDITFVPSEEYDISPVCRKQTGMKETRGLPGSPIYETIDPYHSGHRITGDWNFSIKCKILSVFLVVIVCFIAAGIVIPLVIIQPGKSGHNWSSNTNKSTLTDTNHPTVSINTSPPSMNPSVKNYSNLELLVNDNFSTFDRDMWNYMITASGSGNWEFQVYTPEESNVYVKDDKLFIHPTLTDDHFGENFVKTGTLDVKELWGKCTEEKDYGCLRSSGAGIIINPVMSGKISTKESFKYGRVEVIAKMALGDWLWPSITLLPETSVYGEWPRSGQITLVESRGNRDYGQSGVQRASSALHWGTNAGKSGAYLTKGTKYLPIGEQNFGEKFVNYTLIWKASGIQVYYDSELILDAPTPEDGYAAKGRLQDNPWETGDKDAPFDKKFYLSISLGVGGTNGYFPDDILNKPKPKPWINAYSPNYYAQTEFWDRKAEWYPTWLGDDAALQVQSVKIWRET